MDDILHRFELAAKGGLAGDNSGHLKRLAKNAVGQQSGLECIQHPLGFYYVRPCAEGTISIRIHYWPANSRPEPTAVTQYHDHVWSLQSCVLTGTIENILVNLEPDEAGPYAITNIEQINGIDHVIPSSERVRIHSPETSTYVAGDCYSIPPRVFHRSYIPTEVDTITILRAEVVMTGGPRTLVPAGYSGQAPTRTSMSTAVAEKLLRQMEELL